MQEIDDKVFKECLNVVATSEEGKIVFAYLKDVLGWDDIYMSLENTNQANTYYQTRRAVYGWLRNLINKDDLQKIEFYYKRKAVENDRGSAKRISRGTSNKRSTD